MTIEGLNKIERIKQEFSNLLLITLFFVLAVVSIKGYTFGVQLPLNIVTITLILVVQISERISPKYVKGVRKDILSYLLILSLILSGLVMVSIRELWVIGDVVLLLATLHFSLQLHKALTYTIVGFITVGLFIVRPGNVDVFLNTSLAILYASISVMIVHLLHRLRIEVETTDKNYNKIQELNEELYSIFIHNLKTPLTEVITELEINKMAKVPKLDGMKESIGKIALAVEQMTQFVTINRVQSNMRRETILVEDFLQELVISARALHKGYPNLDFRVRLYPQGIEGTEIVISEESLSEAILNIIENSIKHNQDSKQISVEITSYKDERNLNLRITDNGKGFSKEVIEEFKTKGISPDIEGEFHVGLKLANAATISHGGSMELNSIAGGAEVIIKLPLN